MKFYHILVCSSLVMPVTNYWVICNYNLIDKFPLYLTTITTLGAIVSMMFWIDPIKHRNQWIHKMDAVSARFVILNYTIYKLVYNQHNLLPFLWNYIPMLYYFHLSHKLSSKNWCSTEHIWVHIIAHLYCVCCCYISFF